MGRLALDGVPTLALARRWGVPQAGVFRRLPSSLDAVHDLGAQGAPHGTAVVAEEQTAGRGRGGRTWHSPVGGVWLGMLFRPPGGGAGAQLGAVAIRAGLVLADVVDEILGRASTQLKWPNDVLLAERKVAGILCEGRWQGDALQWLAVGVGVNVCNPIPAELAARAIALEELAPGVQRIDLLDKLVPALLPLAAGGGRALLSEAECEAFVARDWLSGRLLRQPVFGRACGVSNDGALLVDSGSGTTRVREGHVELA